MKQIENLTLQLGEAERNLAEKEEDMESLDKSSKDEVIIITVLKVKAFYRLFLLGNWIIHFQ